jgi:nucleotide-binding universal stress UspA family protein
MSYAALMVHFDAGPSSQRRLKLAIDLANRFEAALIGVAGRSYLPAFIANNGTAADERNDGERREMTHLLAEIEKKFRAAAKQVTQVEWRGRLEYANDLVPREARAADLVVIGHKQDARDLYYALDPAVIIVRVGRPILVVPDNVDSLAARRVVVAWKDTRESRRAVRDALPFLQAAKEVKIVEVSEQGTEAQSRQRIDDVADYLLRHGVAMAGKAYLHTERSAASELLRFVKDEQADLIVAGGYGHTRLGEWMFGGVTRDLLAGSPVCCLFSH